MPSLNFESLNLTTVKQYAHDFWETILGWLVSPPFYAQLITIIVCVMAARPIARYILNHIPLFRTEPEQGRFLRIRKYIYACRDLILPAVTVLLLALGVAICDATVHASWGVRIAESIAVVLLLYVAINRFISNPIVNLLARWIGIPLAALAVFGYYDDFVSWLDSLAFSAGNIRISALALAKAAIFGGILFWLGRVSSSAGQKVIRDQHKIDIQTRELAAKFFEITIFIVVAILLLNILGLDLTALAVFSGALGVGLGFGLQQIASNFISGIIILLERSLKVGDYIELEEGKGGVLKEINMRSSSLETFDGKEIMVPNERFITTAFVNWTKSDPNQRYEVPFMVTYKSDIHRIPALIEAVVAGYPAVLSEPALPSCCLNKFGEKGVHFTVDFWITGVEDARRKYLSDIHFLIWDALKGARITMAHVKLDDDDDDDVIDVIEEKIKPPVEEVPSSRNMEWEQDT